MYGRDKSDGESKKNKTNLRVQILHDVKSLWIGRAIEKDVLKSELAFRIYCSTHIQSETNKRANQILDWIMGEIL